MVTKMSEAGHIPNIYEDLNLPLSEVFQLIDDIKNKKILFDEKIDGQNFTFTWRDNQVWMLGKGTPKSALKLGGHNIAGIKKKYEHLPKVRDMFVSAYEAMDWICRRCDKSIVGELFRNGEVAIECALIDPNNPNIIRYDEKGFVFLKPHVLVGQEPQLWLGYADFICYAIQVRCAPWKFDSRVILGQVNASSVDVDLEEVRQMLYELIETSGLTQENTVGDLCVELVKKHIEERFQQDLLSDIAHRLVYRNAKVIGKKRLKSDWKAFQAFEKNRDNVNEALIPLEKIVQLLGVYVIDAVDFVHASNAHKDAEYIIDFVKRVRRSYELNLIDGTPEQLEQIRISLRRIDETLIRKPAEGVVFFWKRNMKEYKLTGMFAALNKLYATFRYSGSRGRVATFKPDFIDVIKPGSRDITSTVEGFRKSILDPLELQNAKIIDDIDCLKFEVKSKETRDIIFDNLRLLLGSQNVRQDDSRLLVKYPLIGEDDSIQIEILGVSV